MARIDAVMERFVERTIENVDKSIQELDDKSENLDAVRNEESKSPV